MPTEPDFTTEVDSGDRQRGLLALRSLLARKLEDAAPRDVASLSRRLMQVMEELEAIGAGNDDVDELGAAREAKLGAAAGVQPDVRAFGESRA